MATLASDCLVRRCRRGAWQLAGRASGGDLSQLRARSAVMTPTLLPPRSLRPLSFSFYKPTKSSIEPHSSLTPTSSSIWSCNKTFLPSPNPYYFHNDHSNTELPAGANSFAYHSIYLIIVILSQHAMGTRMKQTLQERRKGELVCRCTVRSDAS